MSLSESIKQLVNQKMAFSSSQRGSPCCCKSNKNSDWLSYGKDLKNTRSTTSKLNSDNIDKLEIKWNYSQNASTQFGVPWTSVLAANGSIFASLWNFTNLNSQVVSLNSESGIVQWSQTNAFVGLAVTSSGMSIGNGLLFVSANDFANTTILFALNIQNGNVVWQSPNLDSGTNAGGNFLGGAPVFIKKENIVIACLSTSNDIGESGIIFSINAKTGNIIWQYSITGGSDPTQPNYSGSGAGIFGSPAIDRKSGLMFIGTGQNNGTAPSPSLCDALLALDYKTGKLIWYHQYTSDDNTIPANLLKDWDIDGGPILLNIPKCKHNGKSKYKKIVVIGSKEGNLYAHKRKNGKLLWKTVLTNPNPVPSGVGGINTFGCANPETNTLYYPSIYSTDGQTLNQYGTPYFTFLPVNCATGIFAIQGKDGHILWRKDFPGCTLSPLTYSNGMIFFQTTFVADIVNGNVANSRTILRVLNAENGKTLFEFSYAPNSDPTDLDGNDSFGGVTIYKNKLYMPYGTAVNTDEIGGILAFSLKKC